MDVALNNLPGFILRVLLLSFLLIPCAHTKELYEFYRGTRAMGMGGAMTALADDADSVFYNPAGLALNDAYEVRLINPKIDVSADDITSIADLKGAATKLDAATVSNLFGKHIYGNATIFPSLHFPNFALGYFASSTAKVIARNLAMPSVEATYLLDNGVVGGFGFEMRGISRRHYMRLGTTLKYNQRLGFDRILPVTDLLIANKAYFQDLLKGPAFAFGFGLGIQYEIPMSKRDELILGASWQDIGDTQFIGGSGGGIPPIANNLAAGGAFIHRFGTNLRSKSNVKFAAELRHLAQSGIDPRLRMHFGVEMQFSAFSIWGGVHQDSITGGVKTDLWFLEVAAVTYGVENQSLAFMDRERRYMLELTLKFDFMSKKSKSLREQDRSRRPRMFN